MKKVAQINPHEIAGKTIKRLPKQLIQASCCDTRWQNFKIATRQGMLLLASRKKGVANAPYDLPISFLKREIYKLVCQFIDDKKELDLKSAIEADRWPHRPGLISFSDNPFHWAFFGFRDPQDESISRYQVSRFGRQLLYAKRHKIPVELLIGFIYQTDGFYSIYRKASQPEAYEEWFLTNQNSLEKES